ncbi:hypothetical protein HELRODRAFT_176110 [Helobdella robusta]|uniref:Uncharacterized protein n=1 Tax=Helobdella robusta TaxID=6412 RepID=T1FA52_HELRO|nr:hypothetical protein HELRODRAFT_176110 [Helobdella robusta]ESO00252.1 hypothetical protein HELRODRAFT_176110 [Helobdella robusta]
MRIVYHNGGMKNHEGEYFGFCNVDNEFCTTIGTRQDIKTILESGDGVGRNGSVAAVEMETKRDACVRRKTIAIDKNCGRGLSSSTTAGNFKRAFINVGSTALTLFNKSLKCPVQRDTILSSPTLCASHNLRMIDVGNIGLSGYDIAQKMLMLGLWMHPGSLSLITLLEKGVDNDLFEFRIEESDSVTVCVSQTISANDASPDTEICSNSCVKIANNYNFVIFMYSLKTRDFQFYFESTFVTCVTITAVCKRFSVTGNSAENRRRRILTWKEIAKAFGPQNCCNHLNLMAWAVSKTTRKDCKCRGQPDECHLTRVLNADKVTEKDIVRITRLGKKEENSVRLILVKFENLMAKDNIMWNIYKTKSIDEEFKYIGISQDLTID